VALKMRGGQEELEIRSRASRVYGSDTCLVGVYSTTSIVRIRQHQRTQLEESQQRQKEIGKLR
jgi:hypothetical protein